MTRHELAIPSMHCEHCAGSIQRYLRDQPGVQAAEVDYGTERGRLEVDPDADLDGLLEALEAMGYEATLVE